MRRGEQAMIFGLLLLLLCLSCTNVDGHATVPKAGRRDQVSSRDIVQDPRCNQGIKIKTKGCKGELIERYAYSRKTGKCVDYYVQEDCFQHSGNEFETRVECLEACNRTSVCLENDMPELLTSNRKNKLYYYDPIEDFCEEALPNIAAKNLWPHGNLFYSQRRCIRECKPGYKQKGKYFRK